MASNYAFIVLECSQHNRELFRTKLVAFRHCFHITGIFVCFSCTKSQRKEKKQDVN